MSEYNNFYGYDLNAVEQTRETSTTLAFSSVVNKVYIWMTMALVLTGLTAYYVAGNESLLYSIIGSRAVLLGMLIGEIALVWILSANIMRMSFPVAGIMFGLYSILNGATLSVILLAYTMESVATTFFVTAGTFGAMSLVGAFIKKDLSGMGRFLMMALIGLVLGTIVNIFVASTTFSWVLTYVGIILFCGLTAYDTQKMKDILRASANLGDQNLLKIALMCSLSLYLDFVNLFLYLLRIFGNRRS